MAQASGVWAWARARPLLASPKGTQSLLSRSHSAAGGVCAGTDNRCEILLFQSQVTAQQRRRAVGRGRGDGGWLERR